MSLRVPFNLITNLKTTWLNLLGGAKSIFQKKFLYDVFKTFIGVLLAFWVNEWKTGKQSRFTEATALSEIRNELVLDIEDLESNLQGHVVGHDAAKWFSNALHSTEALEGETLRMKYSDLLLGFTSIQHSTTYETVKSRGLEIIRDDSLRTAVINLYDFHFEAIEKLEEEYPPHNFFQLYFFKINEKLLPHFIIEQNGAWKLTKPLSAMSEIDKTEFVLWLQKIGTHRAYMKKTYEETIGEAKKLQDKLNIKLKQ